MNLILVHEILIGLLAVHHVKNVMVEKISEITTKRNTHLSNVWSGNVLIEVDLNKQVIVSV